MSIYKNGIKLDSLDAWQTHAGPKSPDQWVDGRSAKEVARAWIEAGPGELPLEVKSLLDRHPAFAPLLSWEAEPEAKLRFDEFAGETRNSDLVVHGEDKHGRVLIAVEAKADESFAETIGDTLAAALERKLQSNTSNGIARIEQLAAALLGPREKGDAGLKNIRYQLLTACAGALCDGQRRGCSRVLVLIQEFVTPKTEDKKHHQNARDLNRFIRRLSHGTVDSLSTGDIVGPFYVPGAPLVVGNTPLFIGKVSRNLRS